MNMDGMLVAAILIFAATLTLVIWQPRGIGIGWTASFGALLALLCGVVSLHDVWEVAGIVWNATFAFVAIILISLILDEIGLFEWSALHMVRLAGGSGIRMFLYLIVLTAVVAAFFTNDGAALIMTPIVLAMMRTLRFEDRMLLPFVMACGFIADTTSLPLVISNLVNIVTADYFHIGFAEYAGRMIVPNLVSLLASTCVLYLFFRKPISERYSLNELGAPREVIKDVRMFRLSWVILGILFAGYFLSERWQIPVSFVIGLAAAGFLIAAGRSAAVPTKRIIREAPWSIVVFSLGMYIVVYGLQNVGLTDLLGRMIACFSEFGLYASTLSMGFLAAFLSSSMNNLPTIMINNLAIDSMAAEGMLQELLIYANVIGSDLGPKITPIGSLATLLWLNVLSRKGVHMTWGYYFRVGLVLTVPTLLMTLTGLYLWIWYIG